MDTSFVVFKKGKYTNFGLNEKELVQMKTCRRKWFVQWVAAFVSIVLFGTYLGSLSMNTLTVSAICCRKDGFDKSRYTLTGNVAQDVATIAKSQAGRTCSDFGYSGVDYGAWCDEYVADCLENAGCDDSIVAHGGTVADFEKEMRKRGAVIVSSPHPGDLLFFSWSHVEIVTRVEGGTVYCAGGNNQGKTYPGGRCAGERNAQSVAKSMGGSIRLYLRPNYPNPDPPKPAPTLTVLTGNSSIETTFSWNTVEGATEYDVKIWKGTVWEGDAYLVEWGASNPYSVVLPEGTYQAYVDARFGSDMQMSNIVEFTVKAGCKLNVEVGNSSAETKFTWNDVNNATEYDVKIWKGKAWEGDPYLVEWGASNPYSVILPEGTYQAYVDTRFGSDMQMSNIVEFTVKAGCKLNVEVGNTSAETKFTWNDVNNATGYDVKIWKGKVWEGDPYLVEWGASNPYSVVLPEGTYQAYVDTRFGSDMQMSNVVEFTVKAGCKLNVEVGNTSTETKFTWNDVNNATGYDVKIWKGKVWEGDPYLVEWGASNPYSVVLPEGTYQAYVDTRFGSDMQMSNIVTFNVTKAKIQIGDLNSDNTLTTADAVLLQRYLLQERTLTQSQWQTADLNADGTVNGFDLALLRQKLVA